MKKVLLPLAGQEALLTLPPALRIPQKMRISGSLVVILVVFLVTAIFVKVDMAPLPFFTLTMIKIICINCEFLRWPQN